MMVTSETLIFFLMFLSGFHEKDLSQSETQSCPVQNKKNFEICQLGLYSCCTELFHSSAFSLLFVM